MAATLEAEAKILRKEKNFSSGSNYQARGTAYPNILSQFESLEDERIENAE